MLAMLWDNLATILVALVVFGAVGVILYRGYKNRKSGKHTCSCGGSCGGCANSALCHPSADKKSM